ncbi:GNAT family N-acetyltransferase [Fulvivirga ulvae]|uniref:GNAT family N-acetyltransferase n=1 Tax=Fulvivirga ulvae TaxID=2904245 RepID=UPI001F3E7279|nr:GNAT family N-acetyltransferase [Fulvivirga ulvae]UII35029.1 GNAT family N-acetyltransferase [Fulvivirga ulvae]
MSDIKLPEKLWNTDILLQALSIEDADEFYNCFKKFEVVYRYHDTAYERVASPQQFTLRMMRAHNNIWTIRLADEPQMIIGSCALHGYSEDISRVDIGGAVLPEYRDHLFSALNLTMKSVQEKLRIKIVVGKTTIKNQMAIEMAEKLGFLFIYSGKSEAIVRWVV